MTDLQDRLGRLAPSVDVETTLAGIHDGIRRERRRRRVVAGVTAAAAVIAGAVGAVVLDRADDGDDSPPVTPVEEGWVELADAPFDASFVTLGRVWTGEEAIWWGIRGQNGPMWGAAYNPSSDSWRVIADSPIQRRLNPAVVWTGEEMVVWGGDPAPSESYEETGAAYEPATDSWRVIADAPIETRGAPLAAMVGDELVVTGGRRVDVPPVCSGAGPCEGQQPVQWLTTGAAYDPSTDTWRPIAREADALGASEDVAVTSTGTELLAFNTIRSLAYDVETDRWRELSPERSRANDEGVSLKLEIVAAGGTAVLVEDWGYFLYRLDRDEWVAAPMRPIQVCSASLTAVGDRRVLLGCSQAVIDSSGEWTTLPPFPGPAGPENIGRPVEASGTDDMLLVIGPGSLPPSRLMGYRFVD